MGNLLCMMTHCWGRGYDVIVGDKSHIFKYEQGGVSHIAGAMLKTVPNQSDGTLLLQGFHIASIAELCLDFHFR